MQEQIEKVFESVCRNLPESFSDTCTALVDNYTDQLLDLIVNHLSPEEICRKLKFCVSKELNVLRKASISDKSTPDYIGNDLEETTPQFFGTNGTCNICRAIVEGVRNKINNNQTLVSKHSN